MGPRAAVLDPSGKPACGAPESLRSGAREPAEVQVGKGYEQQNGEDHDQRDQQAFTKFAVPH